MKTFLKKYNLYFLYVFMLSFLFIGLYKYTGYKHFGSLILYIAVFSAVYFSLKSKLIGKVFNPIIDKVKGVSDGISDAQQKNLFFILGGGSVLFVLGHFFVLEGAPVFKVISNYDYGDIVWIRRNITSQHGMFWNYGTKFLLKAIFPVLLLLLFIKKRWWLFLFFTAVSFFYGAAMLQKSYFVTLYLPVFFYALFTKRFFHAIFAWCAIIGGVAFLVLITNPSMKLKFLSEEEQVIAIEQLSAYKKRVIIEKQEEQPNVGYGVVELVSNRLFVVPGEMVAIWFKHVPEDLPFLNGCGYRIVAAMKGCEHREYVTELYPIAKPEFAARGFKGSLNVGSFMYDYVNFGKWGLVISAVGLAFIMFVIEAFFEDKKVMFALNAFYVLMLSSSAISTLLLSGGWGVMLPIFLIFRNKLQKPKTIIPNNYKVCHVTTVHKYNDNRIFYKEIQSLKKEGFEMHMMALAPKSLEFEGVKIHALLQVKSRLARFVVVSVGQVLLKALFQVRADVYHFHDPELMIVGNLLRFFGVKVVFDVHENNPAAMQSKPYLSSKWKQRVMAGLMDVSERTLLLSFNGVATARPDISERLSFLKPATVCNFPILPDLNKLKEVDITKDKFTAIYVGGLSDIRGIRELITSFKDIDAELWLLGPFETEKFQKECEALPGWEKVNYIGIVEPYEIFSYIKKADVGIITFLPFPNHLRTLATKPFEYMACGVPVIMSDFPYWRDFFKDASLYVDPEKPESIQKALLELAENQAKKEKMGSSNLELAQKEYSWGAQFQFLNCLYNKVLLKD